MLRCTKKLLNRLNLPTETPGASASSPPNSAVPKLGDWYATYITARPRHLVFAVSQSCRLSILLPAAPLATLPIRLLLIVAERLAGLDIAPEAIEREIEAMMPLVLAPTGLDRSRSTLGTMNSVLPVVQYHLEEGGTPEEIMDYLEVYLVRGEGAKSEYIRPGKATKERFEAAPNSENLG
jgi:hypothetical protein